MNKKILFLIFIFIMLLLTCEEERAADFVKIDKEMEYFNKINPIFRTGYNIKESLEIVKKLNSDINIYETESIILNRIIQFGGFTKNERKNMNIKTKILNINLGYLPNPENFIKGCKDITFLVQKVENNKKVVGWKFIIERKKAEPFIRAIENEYGLAGNVHDAFGWKTTNNRYLYTIYPNDITFTIISENFINSILSLLG